MDKAVEGQTFSGIERMKHAMDALRNAPPVRAISAMPVVVFYMARIGMVEHSKQMDEHVFTVKCFVPGTSADGHDCEKTEERSLNAYAMRNEFFNVTDWSGAYDFLCASGDFWPLDNSITWSEFRRWQDFARLVLEHQRLAEAMNAGERSGECAEALKALSGGIYPSLFFDFPRLKQGTEEIKRTAKLHPEMANSFFKSQKQIQRRFSELPACFRKPSQEHCSIEWVPKTDKDAAVIEQKLRRGGAMIEYLLSKETLRPVFLIRPSTTLEAIAATIYADFCNGVEYRTCEFCHKLFRVGKQKTQRFCDNNDRCKNAAHSQRERQKIREKKLKSIVS